MLINKKYNKLNINERIDLRYELKIKQKRCSNTFDFALDLAKTALSFLEKMNNDNKQKTVYKLIK